MKKGITVAGTILVDIIKKIDSYPEKGMLSSILSISKSAGGCVPNVAIDLAKLGGVHVKAAGRIGKDAEGDFVLRILENSGVAVENVIKTDDLFTGFTDVMTVNKTGERTFFNMCGANAVFCDTDLTESMSDTDIFHIGYILLLDALDASDEKHGTRMARLLHAVRERGCKTSIDTVSSSTDNFSNKLLPALKYCNYAILNEIESGLAVGIAPRAADGKIIEHNIRGILEAFVNLGVEKAVVHCPEAGFCMGASRKMITVPSLSLPPDYIKGSVGAGDAFCAGVLYGFNEGLSDSESLELASLMAAANLAVSDSISGALSLEETIKLENKLKRRTLK